MPLEQELVDFIVGQEQLSELEVFYPNVLTYEMFSTLLLLLTSFFILWFIRLLKLIFDISDLSMAIRAHHLRLIHIVNFDLLESLWAQGNIRSYISLLFSKTTSNNNLLQHVKSPNLKVEPISLPIIFPLENVSCLNNDTLSFDFLFPLTSSYTKCGVQVVWNLQDATWRHCVLLPFLTPSQQEMVKQSNTIPQNSSTVQLSNHQKTDWLQKMNIPSNGYLTASAMQYFTPNNQTNHLEFPIHSTDALREESIPLLVVFSFFKDDAVEEEEEVVCFYYLLFYFQTRNPTSPSSSNSSMSVRLFKHLIHTNQSIYLLQDVYGHFDQNEENHEEEEECCVICLSEPRQVTLLPCRHLCVCHDCFAQIEKCPICRLPVNSFIQ